MVFSTSKERQIAKVNRDAEDAELERVRQEHIEENVQELAEVEEGDDIFLNEEIDPKLIEVDEEEE